ncbi:hypothetical protein [Nonomuraea salmonea]|uniref:hypothetical protein n=1 Tax=Nonomuraea salmonea TaxID=46181 RepID=UPI002FE91BC5
MLPSAAQRLARWLITAVACAYTVITLTHFQNGVAYGLPAAATMVAVLAAHFVNMRAGLRDERPPLHPLPLVLQAVLTYLPDLILPGGGSALAAPLLAGALLVFLPLPWGSALIVLMMLYEGWALWAGPGFAFLTAFYVMTVPTTGGHDVRAGPAHPRHRRAAGGQGRAGGRRRAQGAAADLPRPARRARPQPHRHRAQG